MTGHTGMTRVRLAAALALAVVLPLAGCTAGQPARPTPARTTATASTPTATPTATPASTPTPTPTADPIADLTLPQRVGQLFMVGTSDAAADAGSLAAVRDRHVGSIFLHNDFDHGTHPGLAHVQQVVGRFTALVAPATTGDVPLWVATDQEGGDVQVLSGPGFSRIPSALTQGGMAPTTLQADAAGWARELARAGVDVNLAPVADIVTSPAVARQNKPIGLLNRQYGFDEQTVARQAGAFAAGMRQSGVMPTFKHFPGLGRTTSNTDYAPAVDTTIGQTSPDVNVYRQLTAGGPALVMVSTAVYRKLDPAAPSAFSPQIVTGILRDRLGFTGVVITDDLSAAASVANVPPAERAVRAIEAGCDIVLVSSGPATLPAMYDAVLAKARTDPAFAAQVDAAARHVIVAKATLHG